jgi:hypothetical protein
MNIVNQVHGETPKAAQWLAPLAVAKLTPEDAAESVRQTTPEKHVERRMALLGRARTKVENQPAIFSNSKTKDERESGRLFVFGSYGVCFLRIHYHHLGFSPFVARNF